MPPPGDPWAASADPYGGVPRSYRSGTTTTSGVIGIVLSSLWVLIGVFFLWAALVIRDASDDLPFGGDDVGEGVSTGFAFLALLILGCSIWSIVACANLIRRRSWGRMGTIITFSIWTALAVLGIVSALGSEDSNGGGIFVSLVWLGACIAVVWLAAVRATKLDVEQTSAAGGFGVPYQPPPPLYGTDPQGPAAPPPGWGAPPLVPNPAPPPPYGSPPHGLPERDAPPGQPPPPF